MRKIKAGKFPAFIFIFLPNFHIREQKSAISATPVSWHTFRELQDRNN
nr:hypothetical protein [uncultured Chryseobacterium sp.]